jgi:hypothetical protein
VGCITMGHSHHGKCLKFEALKCHFLHSVHYVYSLNLSSQYLYFGQKLRKVLRYMVTRRVGVSIFSHVLENQSFQYNM